MNESGEVEIEDWTMFSIEETTGFSKIDGETIGDIIKYTKTFNPIIQKLFEQLIRQCIDNFDFSTKPISFIEYMEFYKEVNRIIPKLKKKILYEDHYSTTFFIGDTHGAIFESFILIDSFYKLLKKEDKIKIIFLGDYVDRNPYDLENLTLIVAFSLLFPENVTLIRGNHEDRLINAHYGFLDNLLRSFYDKGEELYEEILKIFTRLPIAHVSIIHSVENKIAKVLSVHGGIPINLNNFMEPVILKEIEEKLVCEVEESIDMDEFTTSILWSDPDDMIKGILTGDHLQGRIRFGKPVFDKFMRANKLDLLVRGHQNWKDGIKILFNRRLYSIFSTSTYDGKKKFNPKILKLNYGQSPEILSIDFDNLEEKMI